MSGMHTRRGRECQLSVDGANNTNRQVASRRIVAKKGKIIKILAFCELVHIDIFKEGGYNYNV